MKERLLLILSGLVFFMPIIAHGQNWLWAKKSGGFPNEESRCIVNDPTGNVIITGAFRTAVLSVGPTNLVNRSNTGTSDVLVIKYNANGAILWATSLGGTANDAGRSVATDAAGNIYITGYFRSDVLRFGTDSILNTSATFADLFVAKINPSGVFQWVKHLNGLVNEFGNGIATDSSGVCYVTGYYSSDTLLVAEDTLLNRAPGALDILVVKIDSQGNFIWGKSYGGPGSDQGQGMVVLPGERVGLTAYYNSDTLRADTNNLRNPAPGFDDFITAVLDSSGEINWIKSFGNVSDDRAYGIASDDFGNLLLAGRYGSPLLQLDTITLTNFSTNLTADFFLLKMDYATGACKWAMTLGDSLDEIGEGICADVNGTMYAIGRFSSNKLVVGSSQFNNYVISGTSDILLTAFDSTGNNLWSITAGKSANDFGMSVTTKNNRIFITGYFRDTSITFGTFNLINGGAGNQDIFTAALGPPSPLPVELVTFDGVRQSKNSVLLKWMTASEKNNDHFTVERSMDGMTFNPIGLVSGNRNSQFACSYQHTDNDAPENVIYYRLKQVDADGAETTYLPIVVKQSNPHAIEPVILTNPPPNGIMMLYYEPLTQDAATISIVNETGQVCHTLNAEFGPGQGLLRMDLSSLRHGIYMMSFKTATMDYVTRFILE